jgi:hypothetical protein
VPRTGGSASRSRRRRQERHARIECLCGRRLEAPDELRRRRLCRGHVDRERPDMRIDAQIRTCLTAELDDVDADAVALAA